MLLYTQRLDLNSSKEKLQDLFISFSIFRHGLGSILAHAHAVAISAAIGPYSQGISTGKLLFTSGQLPVNPADGAMPEGIAAQAEWSCKNVGAILEAAGSGFEKVVKTTCFLADIADFAAFNEVYARYFTSKPARSCVAVKDLPKGALCEIEAVAELD